MPFYIENIGNGLVLDIKESDMDHHGEVIMFTLTKNPNQLWDYRDGMIVSQLNGMVLDVNEETGHVITYPGHGGPNQQWTFQDDGSILSGDGKVLDVHESNRMAGGQVIAFPKHGGENQQFRMVPV